VNTGGSPTWLSHCIVFIVSAALAVATFAVVHESGHFLVYWSAGVDPSFQWLNVLAKKTPSDGVQLTALSMGLLFQLIPGAAALLYLVKKNAGSTIALGVLFASWLFRSLPASITLAFTDTGDERAIQAILAEEYTVGIAWTVAVLLALVPVVMFVAVQLKRGKLAVGSEWWNPGVLGAFIGIGVAISI